MASIGEGGMAFEGKERIAAPPDTLVVFENFSVAC
jgi:hypothetical protein